MKRTRILTFAALSGITATVIATAAPAHANPNLVNPIPGLNGTVGLPQLSGPSHPVAQLTGMLGDNRTQDSNVLGTDLGIMWDNGQGEILTAFGDTAGLGIPNLMYGSLWSWRSSSLFRSADRNLADGMAFHSTPRDPLGQSKELLPSPKIPGVEISKIPTAGIAVGGMQVMSMMSVNHWGDAGRWATNNSQLAFSHDNGENWASAESTIRPNEGGNANFQMGAFLKSGGYIYQYGTPSGRGGLVHVSRVTESNIMNLGAYEYWDGGSWVRGNPGAAVPVADGGVGELSVSWNDHVGQFLMLTTDNFNNVVMRRAPAPTGPWSAPEVLVAAHELPSAYGAYIHPWSAGPDLYFLTTVHSNYNVLLMRTTLHR